MQQHGLVVGRQETEYDQVQEWGHDSEGQTSLVTSGKADLEVDQVWGLESLTGPDKATQTTGLEIVSVLSNPRTFFQPRWPSFVCLAFLQYNPPHPAFFFFGELFPHQSQGPSGNHALVLRNGHMA